jgi:hypothetical protein
MVQHAWPRNDKLSATNQHSARAEGCQQWFNIRLGPGAQQLEFTTRSEFSCRLPRVVQRFTMIQLSTGVDWKYSGGWRLC